MAQIKALLREEIEFKAAWFHERWREDKAKSGWHHPRFHVSPYKVAPPLRDDGKTYCGACSAQMVPYAELTEEVKELDRAIVRRWDECEKAWKAHSA